MGILLASCGSKPDSVTIGSKNFTEQIILGELLAQHLASAAKIPVRRLFNLGGTFICHQALTSGQIDLYVEYTGTAYTAILKHQSFEDREKVYERVKEEYARKFTLEWTEPLGFNNTFAIVIRGEDARRLNLRTLTDAARHTPQWRAGFGYEFMERADGYQGLARTYRLRFAEQPRIMDLGLIYRALVDHQVDLVAGNSTDGLIARMDLVVLEDDQKYFPPYDAAPVVRRQTLEKFPALRKALHELAGSLSEADMRELNHQVDGEHRDVAAVVRAFLQSK